MQLTREDLWSLEEYSTRRPEFRAEVIAHKKDRQLLIGGHILLIFEDRKTIQYQIQEMLRIEKIFEANGIQEELDAYNPLIPDGDNFKCTMLIQYEDVDERKRRLTELVGVEDVIWIRFGDTPKIYPIADEDMERENAEKTSSVHFMRYQLDAAAIAAAKSGEPMTVGVDHPAFPVDVVTVPENIRTSVVGDLA
ncbi:MAG: DUF3501 family protein [Pseudomonadales bacterium]|nr:DUF3501 family protein [Pseudomonadales bacterium]